MRNFGSLKAAIVAVAAGLILSCAPLGAQTIVNPGWENPANSPTEFAAGEPGYFLDTTATGWTMDPTVANPGETENPGYRATFYNNTPGGSWSFWLQTFEASGDAFQIVPGVTAGRTYTFGSQMLFEPNYLAIPGVNTYLSMQFENAGQFVGAADVLNIGSAVTADRTWSPYAVSGLAPAGATQVLLDIGWSGGSPVVGPPSPQSAFADDATLTSTAVPEPASLSILAIGSVALLARRRET